MKHWSAQISVGVNDDVHIRTNLRKADSCLHEPILGALASHLGYEMEPLLKASFEDKPDPRFPEIMTLIRAALADWKRYAGMLIGQVSTLLKSNKVFPLTPDTEHTLSEMFRDHHVRIMARFAGHVTDKKRLGRMIKDGQISQGMIDKSHVSISYRAGRGLSMLGVPRHRSDDPNLNTVVQKALEIDLTPQDKAAMRYAQRRAAMYMRRPAERSTHEMERVLTDAELGSIRHAVAGAVAQRKTPKQLEHDLRNAIQTPSLTNDMERVAITELAFAHNYGAYQALKQQTKKAGHKDPFVYKFVSPNACEDCKRIWGQPGNPKKYRLSFVEAHEGTGGNFGKPRSSWGPVVGPVHPRCTEGPLQFWDDDLVGAINEAADEFMELFGR